MKVVVIMALRTERYATGLVAKLAHFYYVHFFSRVLHSKSEMNIQSWINNRGEFTMASKSTIKLLRQPNENDKLAPQAKVIVKVLTEVGANKAPVERQKIVEELSKEGSELKTRQAPDRILAYYQPKLLELKIIEVTKVEGEKKPKAKKEAATKGPIAGGKPVAASPAAK